MCSNETQVEFGPENVHMRDDFLETVRNGNTERAIKIIESEERISCLGVTIGGNTSLHVVANNGHLDLAREIYSRHSFLLVTQNKMLETPLHCAARAGHDQLVCDMIAYAGLGKERMLRAKKSGGKTALHEATQNSHANVVHELLSHDRELACMVDDEGISPLYMAVLSGSLALVQQFKLEDLPEAKSTFYAGPNGQTALHAAVLYNPRYLSKALKSPRFAWPSERHFFGCSSDYEIAQELLQWKKELARKADNLGATPLHYAASIGNREIAKLLLEHDPSLANFPDSSGSYPIHIAATMGRTGVIEELISQWPNSYELLDDQGRNFFHVAVERRKWRLVSYFSQKSEMSKLMNAADFEGNTPLRLAVESGNKYFATFLGSREGVESRFTIKNFINYWKIGYMGIGFRGELFLVLTRFTTSKATIRIPNQIQSQKPNENDAVPEEERSKLLSKMEGSKLRAESLFLCSVLIATLSFNARLNAPGGYKSDGTPVLAEQNVFRLFVFTDVSAFIYSVVAMFLFALAKIWTAMEHQQSRLVMVREHQELVWASIYCMIIAALSMAVAFGSGVFLVMSSSFHDKNPIRAISIYALTPVLTFAFFTPAAARKIEPFVVRLKSYIWSGEVQWFEQIL